MTGTDIEKFYFFLNAFWWTKIIMFFTASPAFNEYCLTVLVFIITFIMSFSILLFFFIIMYRESIFQFKYLRLYKQCFSCVFFLCVQTDYILIREFRSFTFSDILGFASHILLFDSHFSQVYSDFFLLTLFWINWLSLIFSRIHLHYFF